MILSLLKRNRTKITSRTDVINALASKHQATRYLEIGVRNRDANFNKVDIPHKECVDPDPNSGADFLKTSDAFFAEHPEKRYDLIFIDGLHTGEQVQKDISNALKALNENGTIVLHDCNPPTAFHAREEYEVDGTFPPWNGTSWQGFAWWRKNSDALEMYTVDVDWGIGVVRQGQQTPINVPIDSYEDLESNRVEILNLISTDEFQRRLKS